MARIELGLKLSVCVWVVAGGLGCGSKTAFKERPPSTAQLLAIGRAYFQATDALERAPESKADLKPFLKEWTEQDVFRSPNDNEEFVILWGLDYRDMNLSGHPSQLPVFAYEKLGKDGKRMVLQGGRDVALVTDEDLPSCPFPPPYKAPK